VSMFASTAKITNKATDLSYRTLGPRALKGWHLLSNTRTPYILAQCVPILGLLESVMFQFFDWQKKQTWLAPAMQDTPLVRMSNMSRSPASKAMHSLVVLLNDDDPAGLADRKAVNLALRLHESGDLS
jgi:hypothetical protein